MISKALYNHVLTLQTLARTDDTMGGYTETWTTSGSFRARISPLTTNERLLQNKVTEMITHRVYCDNMDVIEGDRILWGDLVFEVKGITNPSEAFDHLEIDVKEMV